MPDPIIIKTQARSTEPIPFMLDDDKFDFVPPKLGGIMLAWMDDADNEALARQMFSDWFLAGLSDTDGALIRERLSDPDDTLDFDNLNDLMRQLAEAIIGRPTQSPSD